MELDLETGINVLDLLEIAKDEILDHVMDKVFPTARLDVLGASIAAFDEALAKSSPGNPFIDTDMRDAELLKSKVVNAAGWGKTYAQIIQTIEDLKFLLGAPPETEEGRRVQALIH